MRNTVEYTFDNYPNVKVVAYKGTNGTLETNLDKILSALKHYYECVVVDNEIFTNILK